MQLSKKAVQEFKKIYKQEYGTRLSDEEALEKGIKLLKLFQIIYKPLGKEVEKKWRC